jgi:TonB family protein
MFERFVLISESRQTGDHEAWLVTDLQTHQRCELELYPPVALTVPAWTENLKRAATAASQLQHPNIARLLDLRVTAEHTAAIWSGGTGQTIAEVVSQEAGGRVDFPRAAAWLEQLADALDYLHTNTGLVHGALCPRHVVISPTGELQVTHSIVINTLREIVLQSGGRWDSADELPYLSPQRWEGAPVGLADDVYAFGCIAYGLATGSPPFHQGDIAQQARMTAVTPIFLQQTPTGGPIEDVPAPWQALIDGCLAKAPAPRPTALLPLVRAAVLQSAAGSAPSFPGVVPASQSFPPVAPPPVGLPPLPSPVQPAAPAPAPLPPSVPVPAAPLPVAVSSPPPPAPIYPPVAMPAPAESLRADGVLPAEPHPIILPDADPDAGVAADVPAVAAASVPPAESSVPPPKKAGPAVTRSSAPLSALAVKKAPVTTPEPYDPYSKRGQTAQKGNLRVPLILAVVVLIAAGAGWFFWQSGGSERAQREQAHDKSSKAQVLLGANHPTEALQLLREALLLTPQDATISAQVKELEESELKQELAAYLNELKDTGAIQKEAAALELVARALSRDPLNAGARALKLAIDLKHDRQAAVAESAARAAAEEKAEQARVAAMAAAQAEQAKTAERAAAKAEAEAAGKRLEVANLKLVVLQANSPAKAEIAQKALQDLRRLAPADPDLGELDTHVKELTKPVESAADIAAKSAAAGAAAAAVAAAESPKPAAPEVRTPARLISGDPPVYPYDWLAGKRPGEVDVTLTIEPDGKVSDVNILKSTHSDFSAAVIKATRKYRFAPATLNGQPVKTRVQIPFKFNPEDNQ